MLVMLQTSTDSLHRMPMPAAPTLTLSEALAQAHAHWDAGQAQRAEQLCQHVLARWPGQADALHLLGLMAHAYGRLDLAIGHLREACKAPHAPATMLSNLAEMCRQRGCLAEAEAAGRRAVATEPSLASGWNNLGIVLQEAGKLEESRTCLERVVALQPDSPQAHNNLANTCHRLGHTELAERHYQQALQLDPDYARAHSNLAHLFSADGRHEEAIDEAQRAIDLDPQLIDAYLNLAEAHGARHQHARALHTLAMVRTFAAQHPAVLVASARALEQADRLDEALRFARQAVALAPLDAEAQTTLDAILHACGQTDAHALRPGDA